MGNLARAIASAIVAYKGGSYTVDTLAELIDKDINNVSVKVWREDKRIPLPKYGKEGDACCDIYCKSVEYDDEKDRYIVHTGLHFALPDEYEMELRPRSSNTKTELYVPNAPGTLDWGYRGELLIIFKGRTNVHLFRAVEELKDCVRGIPGVVLLVMIMRETAFVNFLFVVEKRFNGKKLKLLKNLEVLNVAKKDLVLLVVMVKLK